MRAATIRRMRAVRPASDGDLSRIASKLIAVNGLRRLESVPFGGPFNSLARPLTTG